MDKKPRDYLVLALDNCASLRQIQRLVEETTQYFGMCKVGLEQFVRFGPSIIDIVRSSDRKIFLDLKLHDIPNTVAQAVAAAGEHEVDLLTVHTSGGLAMLSAAAETAATLVYPPKLIGVTVLTSIDQLSFNRELRYGGLVADHVAHLSKMAVSGGLSGIVCSAADLPTVKPILPADFEIITPGIRLGEGITHDQKRVTSPSEALSAGATRLVIGRAVTEAESPAEAAAKIHEAVVQWMSSGN